MSIHIGTWPIAPGQVVWLSLERGPRLGEPDRVDAHWQHNEGGNSYWAASLGPFAEGEELRYTPHVSDGKQEVLGTASRFRVGPKIYLSLLWHQHQPIYGLATSSHDSSKPPAAERYGPPWVRLHALRDYYSMAWLLTEQPMLHATFNFTPSLLAQLEGYVLRGATDRALELTLTDAKELSPSDQRDALASFF